MSYSNGQNVSHVRVLNQLLRGKHLEGFNWAWNTL